MSPPPPPARTGPSRGWFYVVAVLIIGGPLFCLVTSMLNFNVLRDDTNVRTAGSGQSIRLPVREGVDYWVYLDDSGSMPGETRCEISGIGSAKEVSLDGSLPFAAGETEVDHGTTYRFVGGFTADRTGQITLRCPSFERQWLTKRDDTGFAWIGLACCAGTTMLILGLIVLAVVARARTRAQNRARSPWPYS